MFWHTVVFAFRISASQAGFLLCTCCTCVSMSSHSSQLPFWGSLVDFSAGFPLRKVPEVLILQPLSDSRIPFIALLAARDKLHVLLLLLEDFCTVTTQWFLKKVAEHRWWWIRSAKNISKSLQTLGNPSGETQSCNCVQYSKNQFQTGHPRVIHVFGHGSLQYFFWKLFLCYFPSCF